VNQLKQSHLHHEETHIEIDDTCPYPKKVYGEQKRFEYLVAKLIENAKFRRSLIVNGSLITVKFNCFYGSLCGDEDLQEKNYL
jgi:hypothetical protein